MSSSPPAFRPLFSKVLPVALVALVVAVSFREAPFLGFVDYDDPVAVLDPHLRDGLSGEAIHFAFTASPAYLWHPLTFLSHALDFQIYGDWAGGHHLTNVLLHLASSLLLLAWLRRHTGENALALAVTLLFAIHPLRVESVVWVSERKDVLSLFFYLLVIWFYSEWARAEGARRRRYYLLALAAGVCGVLSKPSLMTLPAILLLVDLWPLGRLGWADRRNGRLLFRRIVEKLPFAGLALAAAVIAWTTWSDRQYFGEAGDLSLPMRVGFACLTYLSYLSRTFVPLDLVPFLSYPLEVSRFVMVAAAIFLAGVTSLTLLRCSRSPWLLAGWLWFLGAILPGSGLITISDHFAPDRYTYLGHVGLFSALVWELASWGRRRGVPSTVGWFALVVALLPLSLLTGRQTGVWRDSESLWRHTLAAKGPNHLVQNQLALALIHAGRVEEGLAELRSAVELNPDFPIPKANLALACARAGEIDEGVRYFLEAGPRLPGRERFRDELISLGMAAGRSDLVAGLWKESIAEDPGNVTRRLAAGDFFYGAGEAEVAMEHYAEAVRLRPDNSRATLSLGAMLIRRGAVDEAIPWLERSVVSAPDAGAAAESHRTLAQAHLLKKSWAVALENYEKGVALTPDRSLLRNELAQLLLDCPEPSLRDPQRALVLAEPLADIPEGEGVVANPRYLRTFARALQANGDIERARKIAASGLESVETLSQMDPLEKPWTREELESLGAWFRGLAVTPEP